MQERQHGPAKSIPVPQRPRHIDLRINVQSPAKLGAYRIQEPHGEISISKQNCEIQHFSIVVKIEAHDAWLVGQGKAPKQAPLLIEEGALHVFVPRRDQILRTREWPLLIRLKHVLQDETGM